MDFKDQFIIIPIPKNAISTELYFGGYLSMDKETLKISPWLPKDYAEYDELDSIENDKYIVFDY